VKKGLFLGIAALIIAAVMGLTGAPVVAIVAAVSIAVTSTLAYLVRTIRNHFVLKQGTAQAVNDTSLPALAVLLLKIGDFVLFQNPDLAIDVQLELERGVLPQVITKDIGEITTFQRFNNLTTNEKYRLTAHLLNELGRQSLSRPDSEIEQLALWIYQQTRLRIPLDKVFRGDKQPLVILGGAPEDALVTQNLQQVKDLLPSLSEGETLHVVVDDISLTRYKFELNHLLKNRGVKVIYTKFDTKGGVESIFDLTQQEAVFINLMHLEEALFKLSISKKKNLVITIPRKIGGRPVQLNAKDLRSNSFLIWVSWVINDALGAFAAERLNIESLKALNFILMFA